MQSPIHEPSATRAETPTTPTRRWLACIALLALPGLWGMLLPTGHPLSSPLIATAEARSKGVSSPFSPLMPVYKQLRGIIDQLLKKGSLHDAKPFQIDKRFHKSSSRNQKHSKKLAQIVNPKVGWLAFEFETTLRSGKLPKLHIRWILARVKSGWRIAEVRSYPTRTSRGVPASQLKGPSLPMAKAAKRLLPWLKEKRCLQLPILTPKDVPIYLPKKLVRSMFRGLKRTRKKHRALCKRVAEMKFDNMSIYVDDIFGFITNGKDQFKGGVMLEWRLQSKGELIFKRYRFRAFR